MSELKLKVREHFCSVPFYLAMHYDESVCDREDAEFCGCKSYCGSTRLEVDGKLMKRTGPCINSCVKYKYKGISAKNWECEEDYDYDCIWVTVGKKTYECEEVFIAGVRVFAENEEEVK